MPSQIKVDQIAGASGNTVTVPSGQTLDISSATLSLPSTIVTTTGTQTLTNKTIGVSQLTGTLGVANGGTGLTTLGTAGQALKVNSGATGLEYGTISTAILAITTVYDSNTSNYFSGQAGTNLSGTTYYPVGARIGGSFTKQSGTSKLMVTGRYCLMHSSSNLHGSVCWVVGYESDYQNAGHDVRIHSFSSGIGPYVGDFTCILTGIPSGSRTVYYAPAVDGTRTHTHELNPNPQSNSVNNYGDTPNKNLRSQMTVIEFE